MAAPQRLLLVAGVLLGTSGGAAMVAWSPAAADATAAVQSDASRTPMAFARERCAECGVVVSVTDIRHEQRGEGLAARAMGRAAEAPGKHYEVTLRMRDGSGRVFLETNPEQWRRGERVVVIAGAASKK